MNVWLHGHCPRHCCVFVTDQGTNPRWVKSHDPAWITLQEQYAIQKDDLHIRRCPICVDELVAQVTKDWHKKTSKAAGN